MERNSHVYIRYIYWMIVNQLTVSHALASVYFVQTKQKYSLGQGRSQKLFYHLFRTVNIHNDLKSSM